MTGINVTVGSAIAKSGILPLQKAALIVGSGAASGIVHAAISAVNRSTIRAKNTTTSISSTNLNSHINKLIDDSNVSPLQEVLFNGEIMNYICLSIIYILIIQFFYKLYLKDKIILNLSWLIDNNINNKLEFYLNKIIKLNKKMSIGWIWFGLTIMTFIINANLYVIHKLCLNLNRFIEEHISFHLNFTNNIFIPKETIEDVLFNLKIMNYLTVITLILLILQVIFKFHLSKNTNNIYIWLTILVLILTLAYTAYTYGDLYTHLNSYVKMYIDIKNK